MLLSGFVMAVLFIMVSGPLAASVLGRRRRRRCRDPAQRLYDSVAGDCRAVLSSFRGFTRTEGFKILRVFPGAGGLTRSFFIGAGFFCLYPGYEQYLCHLHGGPVNLAGGAGGDRLLSALRPQALPADQGAGAQADEQTEGKRANCFRSRLCLGFI